MKSSCGHLSEKDEENVSVFAKVDYEDYIVSCNTLNNIKRALLHRYNTLDHTRFNVLGELARKELLPKIIE